MTVTTTKKSSRILNFFNNFNYCIKVVLIQQFAIDNI